MNSSWLEILSKIHPSNDIVLNILEKAYPSITGICIGTNSNETYCATAINLSHVESSEEAIIALWKLSWCLRDTLVYETWNSSTVQFQLQNYRDEYSDLSAEQVKQNVDHKEFVSWLMNRAKDSFESKSKNAKVAYPDANALVLLKLGTEPHLAENQLEIVLCSHWASSLGVFRVGDHLMLVSWELH